MRPESGPRRTSTRCARTRSTRSAATPRPRSSPSRSRPARRASRSPRRCSAPTTSSRPPTRSWTPTSPRAASPTRSGPASPRAVERRHARARRLRLAGEPARRRGVDVAPARAPAAAGRRGDHRRDRLPDDGDARLPVRARAGLRRRRARHLQPVARRDRRRDRAADARPSCSPTRSATRSTGPGVEALCREHGLVLIEDCCDALGSRIGGRQVGTFGAAATYSFYPAHHMTTGEGGAVACDDPTWQRALGSLREWGRDCWCPPGRRRRSAAAASRAASATCPPATTTSTSSRTSASTSRSPTCRPRSA